MNTFKASTESKRPSSQILCSSTYSYCRLVSGTRRCLLQRVLWVLRVRSPRGAGKSSAGCRPRNGLGIAQRQRTSRRRGECSRDGGGECAGRHWTPNPSTSAFLGSSDRTSRGSAIPGGGLSGLGLRQSHTVDIALIQYTRVHFSERCARSTVSLVSSPSPPIRHFCSSELHCTQTTP